MIVIGLHGARMSGKDTIAERLVQQYGFECVSFADAIRSGLVAMFEGLGLDATHFEDRAVKELPTPALNNRSPRYAMQTLGTEWGRQYMGVDVWCTVLAKSIKRLAEAGADRFVVPDVRMANEAEYLRSHFNAHLWLVYRVGAHFRHDHGSEFELPDRYTEKAVMNDGTIHDLYARVDRLTQELIA